MTRDGTDTTATIRVGPVLPVVRVIAELGFDPSTILAKAGWSPALLADPETTVPYAAAGRLLDAAASHTGCAHIGLLVGEQAGLASLGALGFAVRHAPYVHTALDLLVRKLGTHDRGAVVTLSEAGGIATLAYRVCVPRLAGSEQAADCAMAIGCAVMTALCGPDWRPTELTLARRRPPDANPYGLRFKAPLRFDAEESAIHFPTRWLGRPARAADPELERLLLRLIGEPVPEPGLRNDVRRVLVGMLGHAPPSQDNVARMFGFSSRTLHRRLAAYGTSFQQLLGEVRCESACRLLNDTTLAIGDVALLLNYQDTSAFTRAFTRRLGLSPAAWRAARPRSQLRFVDCGRAE